MGAGRPNKYTKRTLEAAVERYFAREKKSSGQDRKTAKAAYGYYKTMNNTNVPASRFMDQKK